MEFEKIHLGDVATLKNGYAYKSKDFVENGIPVVKIKNIQPPFIDINDCNYVSEDVYELTKEYLLRYGDILISMTGSGVNQMSSAVGKVGRVQFNDKALQNQRVGKIEIIDKTKYDSDFLFYYISQKKLLEYFVINSTGSANQANISKKIIENTPIPNISLYKQKKIGYILRLLDKKIKKNNKIIENLEAQAQAIFKSWFVDFEPFQDGNFVESELGLIPEEWEIDSLDNIANFKNGLAMQKYRPDINEDSLPVLKIKELNIGHTNSSSDRCKVDIDESVRVYSGDVIFSWSGTLMVKIWFGEDAGLNQHLFKVTSDKFEKWFYYFWIDYHMRFFKSIAKDKATTMGHIKRSHLKEARILIPNSEFQNHMNKIMVPIFNLIINLGTQNKTLAQTRDSLLPKLMSGEIDVSNIKIDEDTNHE